MKKYILAHPWLLLLTAVTGGIMQGLMVLETLLTARMIDALILGDSEVFFRYLLPAVAIVVLLWLFLRIGVRMAAAYEFKGRRTLERDFFNSVLGSSISDFNRENSGKYISVLNNDINIISERYFNTVANLSKDLFSVAFAVAAMVFLSPLNALIALAMTFLPLVAPIVYGKRLAKVEVERSARAITLNQKVKDYLSGFEVIKTSGIEKNILPKFFDASTRLMRARFKAAGVAADVGGLSISILVAASFVNYFVAGFFALRGHISVGEVVAVAALSTAVMHPMTQLANHVASLKSAKEIAKQMLDMMGQQDTRPRTAQLPALTEGIVLRNVHFSYEADAAPVLKNISCTLRNGGKYAVVGASGSGKSTLIKIIAGYYDNYEGDVLLGGHQVRDIDRAGLYGVVSVLPQNVFLLDDSFKNNITLYNHHTDAEYKNALQKANLQDVEAALGSHTLLGEGGNTLSGGERQRISIARAILKGSGVMVLDEATASLDNIVAHDIEQSIINMPHVTCLFVTHRYDKDILEKCDGILVMKNGEICEHGTYGELYDRKGYFYGLLAAKL